jgi:hypothetical protein
MVARLIIKAHELGYRVTLGDAYRSPECAKRMHELGLGIINSLHTKRLAIDLNFFKDGVYITNTSQLEDIGEWWESIGGSWGGRFNDGNHFSLEHNGVK